jgi:hypothetical protein
MVDLSKFEVRLVEVLDEMGLMGDENSHDEGDTIGFSMGLDTTATVGEMQEIAVRRAAQAVYGALQGTQKRVVRLVEIEVVKHPYTGEDVVRGGMVLGVRGEN